MYRTTEVFAVIVLQGELCVFTEAYYDTKGDEGRISFCFSFRLLDHVLRHNAMIKSTKHWISGVSPLAP